VAGCCEHGNEPWGSVKGEKFLDLLNDFQLLKEGSASWSYLILSLFSVFRDVELYSTVLSRVKC
jgi:hypothetical protein